MTAKARRFGFLGVLSALALGACADSNSSSPLAPSSEASLLAGASSTLLECEATTSVSTSGTIDLLGGTLSVTDAAGGTHQVVFPANAVLLPTTFTLTVPASKFVEVRVIASDPLTGQVYESISFPEDAQPTLSISYKRCTRSNVNQHVLGLYHIHETTNAILGGPWGAKTGSLTDPQVSGKVPHFTDYAIGTP